MHGNARRRRTRITDFALGARKAKAAGTRGIDMNGAGCPRVRGAAAAFDGELPVGAVGLVARGQRRVGCRWVLLRCGVASMSVNLYISAILELRRGMWVCLTLPSGRTRSAFGRWDTTL